MLQLQIVKSCAACKLEIAEVMIARCLMDMQSARNGGSPDSAVSVVLACFHHLAMTYGQMCTDDLAITNIASLHNIATYFCMHISWCQPK